MRRETEIKHRYGLVAATLLLAGAAGTAWAAAGGLDPAFGGGDGVVVADRHPDDVGQAVAVQPDGSVVTVGQGKPGMAYSRWQVRRFLANGAVDTTFGTGGVSELFGTLGDDIASAVVIDLTGKILVVGTA